MADVEKLLDMSLDAVIKTTTPARGGRGGGRGGARGARGARGGRGSSFSQGRGGGADATVWSRGGARGGRGGNRGGSYGAQVTVESGVPGGYVRAGGRGRGRRGGAGSTPYDRPERRDVDAQWSHDKFTSNGGGAQKIFSRAIQVTTSGAAATEGPCKVVFEGLPFDVLAPDVQEIFDTYGTNRLSLYYDDSDRSKGAGHVIFDARASALKAIGELNGCEVNGSPLTVALGPNDGQIAKRGAGAGRGRGRGRGGAEPTFTINITTAGASTAGGQKQIKGRGNFRYSKESGYY